MVPLTIMARDIHLNDVKQGHMHILYDMLTVFSFLLYQQMPMFMIKNLNRRGQQCGIYLGAACCLRTQSLARRIMALQLHTFV